MLEGRQASATWNWEGVTIAQQERDALASPIWRGLTKVQVTLARETTVTRLKWRAFSGMRNSRSQHLVHNTRRETEVWPTRGLVWGGE